MDSIQNSSPEALDRFQLLTLFNDGLDSHLKNKYGLCVEVINNIQSTCSSILNL